MADTFFGFNATLDNGDHLLPPDDDDCVENEEEEYDALNDETFGDLEDNSTLDDWEQQHEQYAKNVEKTKCPEYDSISDSLQQCSDDLIKDIDQWSINIFNSSTFQATLEKVTKSFIETRLDGGGSSGNRSNDLSSSTNRTTASATVPKTVNQLASIPLSPIHHHHQQQQQQQHVPRQICTVEELEKNLIKNAKSPLVKQQYPQQQHQHQGPNLYQLPPQRLPPGLPIGMPPQVRHLPPPPPHHHHHHHQQQHHPLPPPGLLQHHHHHPHHPPPHPMMAPHFMQTGPPPPPRLLYPHMNYNFPQPQPPPPHLQQQQQQQRNLQQLRQQPPHLPQQQLLQQQLQQQQQQRIKNDNRRPNEQQNHNNNNNDNYDKDEYAGLMTNREKQWLLNIQLLQLNTGTPYFDDYYYTVFKERKAKFAANNHNNNNNDNNSNHNNHHHNNNNNNNNHNNNNNRENLLNDNRRYHQNNKQRTNDNRQDNSTTNTTTLTPRIYTPLQFENSLGKLQCGSVTAPRKIIDMDIVTPDKDNDNNTTTQQQQQQRKTKQLLLELEVLFTLLLKAEDLRNPLAIINMEKLREIKQKQRLRELELAPTSEQKQEILKLFKQESELKQENPQDFIIKILQLLLNNDEQKFASYLNIRKGKQLLIRLLPHLYYDNFQQQLFDIWYKLLLCIPIIGRRDTIGDHLLPKLHPFFKRFIHSCTIHDILEIANSLIEIVNKQQDSSNARCTPLSHQGSRPPLYFVLLNKFGVSALVTLFIRTEYLLSTDQCSKKQQSDWLNFLNNWSEQINYVINKIAVPIEPIPLQIFIKHCNRFNNNSNDGGGDNLTIDKKSLLEKYFVDTV